jgi:hypothetical protein
MNFTPINQIKKLPIGIQDFASIRNEGYHYVDKTAEIHKVISSGKVFFLSRPRRFGKSLLISTLRYFFEGKKEFFEGLAIEKLESDWVKYPVVRIDLNAADFLSVESLEELILANLNTCAKEYGVELVEGRISLKFRELIQSLSKKFDKGVVVLIDEYDKPLLATMMNKELQSKFKSILKSFYGVLKSSDEYLKFLMLTGVTKFGQVSVFSDLNQLQDLSLKLSSATLCGLTEAEILRDFKPEIQALANQQNQSFEEAVEDLRFWYNGYKFEENAIGVYNPFSTLSALESNKISPYWFQTGTPTFLVELLKETNTDLREVDGIRLSIDDFADYKADADKPLPVIYQSGYISIQSYNPKRRLYTLGFPNAEVKYGFLHFVSSAYTPLSRRRFGVSVSDFADEIEEGRPQDFMKRFEAFFAGVPHDLNNQGEVYYQTVIYLIFKLLGQFVQSEVKSAFGRADAVVETPDYVYVFEFKLDGTAEQALEQIDDKGYLLPYAVDGRKLYKIGVSFDSEHKNVGEFLVVEA